MRRRIQNTSLAHTAQKATTIIGRLPLLFVLLLMLHFTQASAQQRKDSIQILFPDTATVIDTTYSATQAALDSIAASLALPPNLGLPITVSTPLRLDEETEDLQDSVRRCRLQSVALFLSEHGVADSLIRANTDSCNVLELQNVCKSATALPAQDRILELLDSASCFATTAALLDSLKRIDNGTPYLYIKEQLLPKTDTATVWLTINGGEWLGTGDYDVYALPTPPTASTPSSVPTVRRDSVATSPQFTVCRDSVATSPTPTVRRNSVAPSPQFPVCRDSVATSPTPTVRRNSVATPPHLAKKSPPAPPKNDMEKIENLQDLISRQHDTINQLRQQLQEALQQGSQSLAEKTSGINYLWLVLAFLLCAILVLAYLWKRHQYAEANDKLRDQDFHLDRLSYEINRLRDDLEKEKEKKKTAAPTPTTVPTAPTPTTVPAVPTPTTVPAVPVCRDTVATVPTPPSTVRRDSVATSPASPAPSTPGSTFENIFHGKSLYESLISGECTSVESWGRDDINDFVAYYRLQKREFVESLENDYNSLSRNHKLFMILMDMGKTDPEIQKLMNITQTTIRSLRFRIKAKRKTGENPQILSLF